MGVQAYYKNPAGQAGNGHAAPSQAGGSGLPPVPRPLRWMVPLLAVYIILLIALPLQLSLDTDALVESIKRNSPDIASERMGFAVLMVNVYNWGLHAVDVVLTIWFLAKALNGRRWAYIALIVYLVIATAASLISAAAGTEYLWAVISCDG